MLHFQPLSIWERIQKILSLNTQFLCLPTPLINSHLLIYAATKLSHVTIKTSPSTAKAFWGINQWASICSIILLFQICCHFLQNYIIENQQLRFGFQQFVHGIMLNLQSENSQCHSTFRVHFCKTCITGQTMMWSKSRIQCQKLVNYFQLNDCWK